MRSDGPTVPNLDWKEPGNEPGAALDAQTPTWPGVGERSPRVRGPDRSPNGQVSATLLGVSLGANGVLLLAAVGLLFLLLNHAGGSVPGGSPSAPTTSIVLSSPTATASPVAVSTWLQVAPSSVRLGCDGGQRTQTVTLENTGLRQVHWQAAVVTGSGGQAGIAVSPAQGDLEAGASLQVQLQNTTRSSGSRGVASQQGVIRFTPAAADAGPPVTLSYATVGCH